MNEYNPGEAPVESAPPLPYKDRSTGLTVFGILTILLGCLAGLFVPLMLAGQAMSAKTSGAPPPFSTLLPALLICGSLAVALVWLGVGSIMARRWSRALLLIFSWSWLFMGLLTMAFMVFFIPQMMANQPAGTKDAFIIAILLVYSVIFVILPAVWTFFFHSRHVKATCEARDPVSRWTDACPLPVLGLCLWLLFSVPMMLIMPVVGHGVMPFFGTFLSGLPGSMLCLAIAALWSYAAWSLYKLEQRGWWLVLIAFCVFMVSGLLTFARHDMTEMYQLMGYPQAQIDQIQKFGLMTGNRMAWMMLGFMVPLLGYLLFIRKFLRRPL